MHNSHKYITYILSELFKAETRRLEKSTDRILESHQEITHQRLDGFMYQGKFYRHSNAAVGGGKRVSLHLDLWSKMEQHLADEKQVSLDHASIHQILFKLIEPCFCLQDIRDAIPDCIIDILPQEIRSLERRRNPEFFLNHERDFKHYAKVLPRIEFYSAARLLY